MAKALKVIGTIAGAVALVATGVGAFAAAGSALAATAGSIATYAGLAAGVSSLGAQLLQKPPPARGSVTQVLIASDAPAPYVMGEGLFGGVLRYQRSYGATLNKVPNPYRFKVCVYSVGGPIESLTPYVDQAAVDSWYSGFLYTGVKLGACPDTALTPQWSGAPGWDSTSKLSGKAAIGWSLKFDKDGKRFANGEPQLGGYGKWVKVYDPRLDSTFPGGSGSHRLGDETTYTWSENPALHAGTYAFGRYEGGKRVMGMGLPADAIDWACVAAWANVCDANSWKIFGPVFEPGDRFANLRDICIAGGGEPILRSSPLSFHFPTPRVALDTITPADIVRSQARSVTPTPKWTDRLNTVFPKYRSPAHNWEMIQASAISVGSYVTEDGEIKQAEWPFNLVKHGTQAAQLAYYRMMDSREFQPIVLPCTLRMRGYGPGSCLQLDLMEELGVSTKAIVLKRKPDHAAGIVWLTLIGETTAKHADALAATGTAPPTPALGQTAQQRDELAAASSDPGGYDAVLIASSWATDADPADGLMQATSSAITIESHTRTYTDKSLAITGATLTTEDDGTTAIAASTLYHVYYDDSTRSNTAPTFKATQNSTVAANSPTQPARHYVGSILTDVSGGTGASNGGSLPPGWTYKNWYNIP